MPALMLGAVALAVGAAAGITESVIAAVPGPKEKERARKLEDMQKAAARKLKRGGYGFDEAEQEQLFNVGLSAVQGAEREYYSRQNELAALQGITGGALIQQDLARQEAAERQRATVGQDVRKLELQQRQLEMKQDKQDIQRQEDIVTQDERARAGAVVQGVSEFGDAAMDFGTFMTMMEMKYGGGGGGTDLTTAQQIDAANYGQGAVGGTARPGAGQFDQSTWNV